MNILFLAHRIPYPPDKGDKIRSFNEIKYLSKTNNIYLGTTLDQKNDEKYITELRQYCREIHAVYFSKKNKLLKGLLCKTAFSVSHFYNSSLQNYVDKTLREKKIDVVICFCSTMAEYIFRTPLFKERKMGNVKLIMDYVDLDSDKWHQYARYTRFPLNLLYKMENKRLFKYEIRINQSFHHSVFISKREVAIFKKLYPEAGNVHVITNGVDCDYFTPRQIKNNSQHATHNSQPILVFTGVMDYFANEDGVNWFCNNIYNRIKTEIPDVQFYIVGNRPTKTIRKLSQINGVTVTGFVDDIRKYYWMANVCVIPLRIARGLQNKVLEAMATGNAVVATSNATNGIICNKNADIVISDGEETFAREVVSLLKNENRRKEMGIRAMENVHLNYSWETNLKKFEELLQV